MPLPEVYHAKVKDQDLIDTFDYVIDNGAGGAVEVVKTRGIIFTKTSEAGTSAWSTQKILGPWGDTIIGNTDIGILYTTPSGNPPIVNVTTVIGDVDTFNYVIAQVSILEHNTMTITFWDSLNNTKFELKDLLSGYKVVVQASYL